MFNFFLPLTQSNNFLTHDLSDIRSKDVSKDETSPAASTDEGGETKYILTWCEAYGSQVYGWSYGADRFRFVCEVNLNLFKTHFPAQNVLENQDVS